MKNLHNALQLKQLYQLKALGYSYTDAKLFSSDEPNRLELANSLEKLKIQAENYYLTFYSKTHLSKEMFLMI